MDREQKEVTDKIRRAIKKKLTQMNAFVDDELPEYIMILIANKRSKAHIEKDLSLFLGSETTEFSLWLDDLLNNFKTGTFGTGAGTISSSVKVCKNDSVGKDKLTFEKNVIEDDEDILALDPQEEFEGDFLSQELINEEMVVPKAIQPKKEQQVPQKIQTVHTIKSNSSTEHKFVLSPMKDNPIPNKLATKQAKLYSIQQPIKTPVSSTVVPMKQPFIVKADDEYDPLNPYVNVSSVVHVTERKFSVPASIQANKMLLRAMDDATKSVLSGQDINEFYKPTPIKVLTSDRNQNVSYRSKAKNDKEYQLNPDSHVNDTNLLFGLSETDSLSPEEDEDDLYESQPSDSHVSKEAIYQNPISVFTTKRYQVNDSPGMDTDFRFENKVASPELPPKSFDDKIDSDEHEQQESVSPHFIVTLEGLEKNLKRKRIISNSSLYIDNEDEMDDEDEMIEDDAMDVDSVPKKQKVLEKCRYWPACKSGNECPYHHPVSPCKLFPNCKFGGSCFYIHPNCKFDALCSRKECPYTHASKRKLAFRVSKPAPIVKKVVSKTVCRFFPNCTSKKCLYLHPTLCWYGRDCQSSTCTFSHLNLPSRNQLKWHA